VTKSDLIQQLSRETGLSQSQSGNIVNDVFDLIARSLQKGEEVRITGFGSFRSAETKQRLGRNPRTGQMITIPAGRRVSFSAGSGLLGTVRGDGEKTRAA